ncbi:MAG: ABC transporter ATP-binding protein [Spirochaetales bacterium]|nr:MAG: ABC transporter ATP-binding protein [Spirochaetales bacterium]
MDNQKIKTISILAGHDKAGNKETVERLDISAGSIVSIVGFTGSGKSQLIGDIEQLAQGDTVSGRHILIDNAPPPPEIRFNPEAKPIAQLSQNMNFILEMTVMEFLELHAECRGRSTSPDVLEEILAGANTLAGEALKPDDVLTRLSGGQSRALMIADVAWVSDSPIILIDEVENAGIDRRKALELLTGKGKIVLIVTHDPQLALLGERRVIMKNGGMDNVLERSKSERLAEEALSRQAAMFAEIQRKIRSGERVEHTMTAIMEE